MTELANPLVTDDLVDRSITIMAADGTLGVPPIVAQGRKLFDFGPSSVQEGQTVVPALVLFLGARRIFFPINQFSESTKSALTLYLQSLSHGVTRNILYYEGRFLVQSKDQIITGQKLQESLQSILLPNSCISVNLAIRNDGKTSVTLRPYFALRILHPDYKGKPVVMAAESPDTGKNPIAVPDGNASGTLSQFAALSMETNAAIAPTATVEPETSTGG